MIDLLASVLISFLNASPSISHFCNVSRVVGKANVLPVMSAANVSNALAYSGYLLDGSFFIFLYFWGITHVGNV